VTASLWIPSVRESSNHSMTSSDGIIITRPASTTTTHALACIVRPVSEMTRTQATRELRPNCNAFPLGKTHVQQQDVSQ